MKCICDLIYKDSGEILKDDKAIKKEDVSVVFDGNRNMYWQVSVKENIYYFCSLKGVFKDTVDNYLYNDPKFKILGPLLDTKYGELSLGQKQIVLVMTNMIIGSKILCLDEPSNGLDIHHMKILKETIKHYSTLHNNIAIVLSHDLDFIYDVSDDFLVINDGQIIDSFNKDTVPYSSFSERYEKILEGKHE